MPTAYRVSDLAGYLLATNRGASWADDVDPAVRDASIERLLARHLTADQAARIQNAIVDRWYRDQAQRQAGRPAGREADSSRLIPSFR